MLSCQHEEMSACPDWRSRKKRGKATRLAAPRYNRAWVMGLAHEKRRTSNGQKPFAQCLKEAWATAKEIAEGDAMRAEWARCRRLFAPAELRPLDCRPCCAVSGAGQGVAVAIIDRRAPVTRTPSRRRSHRNEKNLAALACSRLGVRLDSLLFGLESAERLLTMGREHGLSVTLSPALAAALAPATARRPLLSSSTPPVAGCRKRAIPGGFPASFTPLPLLAPMRGILRVSVAAVGRRNGRAESRPASPITLHGHRLPPGNPTRKASAVPSRRQGERSGGSSGVHGGPNS